MPGCVGTEDDCAVDPPCASDYKTWLHSKKAYFKVINNKVNLDHGEIHNILQ